MDTGKLYDGRDLNVFTIGKGIDESDILFLIKISEGTGDNLLREDIADGYVDYVNWDSYIVFLADDPEFIEEDGGMVLSRKSVREMTIDEIIEAVKAETGRPDDKVITVV